MMSPYIRPKMPMAQQRAQQQRDNEQHTQKINLSSHAVNSAALVRQPTLADIMKALDALNKDIKALSVRTNRLKQGVLTQVTDYFIKCLEVLSYDVCIGFKEMDFDRIWMHMSLASLYGSKGPIWFGPPLNRIIDFTTSDVFSFIPDGGGALARAVPWEDINGVREALVWGRLGNLQEDGTQTNRLQGDWSKSDGI